MKSCPKDPPEAAEALYMGRLASGPAAEFREHVAVCKKCRRTFERTVEFVDAIQRAALELEKAKAASIT